MKEYGAVLAVARRERRKQESRRLNLRGVCDFSLARSAFRV